MTLDRLDFYDTYKFAIDNKIDMRIAASMLAVSRVADATSLRGIYILKTNFWHKQLKNSKSLIFLSVVMVAFVKS